MTDNFRNSLFGLILLLASCDPIGLEDLVAHHEYFLRYDFQFTLGQYKIHAVRYADVMSESGKYKNWFPFGTVDNTLKTCDRSKPECWNTSGSFSIAIPNGDIVDVEFDKLPIALMNISLGSSFNTAGVVEEILRDKIGSEFAYEPQNIPLCRPLKESEVIKTYGKEIPLMRDQDAHAMHINAKVTRIDDPSIQPDDNGRAADSSCKESYSKSSERVTVTKNAAD